MVHKLLTSTFPVRSGEGRLTLALSLHSLCAVGAFVAGRSVRDALFLAHADRSMLAWMYVGSAVAVAATGVLYNPIAARARRDKITVWTALLFAGLFVALWRLEQGGQSWVYPALYIYVEVMGALVLVQFWTLCNEVFNAREAKRLYGLIGAGGMLSNVVIGLLTSRVALRFGASALLPVCAVLLVGAGAAGWAASRIGRERLFARAATGHRGHSKRGGLARVVESPHLRSVAALAVVTFLTTTLVDYHFKVIAGDVYSKNELAAFFGRFYAVVGVLAFALQLFGTGRLLTWLGVIGSLAILPASLLLANAGALVFRALWTASASKGADT